MARQVEKLLDQGAKNGLRENENWCLSTRKSKKPLIDLGEDAEISAEDALLLGRCVIGKVDHVGRWTSTLSNWSPTPIIADGHN